MMLVVISRIARHRCKGDVVRSLPSLSSLSTLLSPCHATSEIHMLRILTSPFPLLLKRSYRSSNSGSYSSLPTPLACAARIVRSPGCGEGLVLGMYCFTASCSSSSALIVARGYCRTCCVGVMCCLMLKWTVDIARGRMLRWRPPTVLRFQKVTRRVNSIHGVCTRPVVITISVIVLPTIIVSPNHRSACRHW